MKMVGNSEGAKKLNGEIQKRIRKDKENYKGKMPRDGRTQYKRKNQRITSADKRNMWKTKNKYRYAKK
jgi:hypothetical protein